MANIWQISGQAGYSLDATLRDADAVGARGLRVRFAELETDVMTYQVDLAGTTPSAAEYAILPSPGQTVTLWKSGARVFSGKAKVAQQGTTVTVEVLGPWSWLEETPIQSQVAGADGATRTRAKISYGSNRVDVLVNDLVNKAVAAGAPFTNVGTSFSSCLTVPPMTLQSDTYAGAISELVRMVPDGVLYFDYSAATPTIWLTRRGDLSDHILASTDLDDGSWSFTPRPEKQQQRIIVAYAERATNGRTVYREQTYPSSGAGIPANKTQIYTISGPEIGETVPNEQVETYSPDPRPATLAGINGWWLATIGATSVPTGCTVAVGDATQLSGRSGSASNPVSVVYTTAPLRFVNAATGSLVNPSGKYFTKNNSRLPEWAESLLGPVEVSMDFETYFIYRARRYNGDGSFHSTGPLPAWWRDNEWSLKKTYYDPITGGAGGYYVFEIYSYWASGTFATLINSGAAQHVQPFAYEFAAPPSGMAQGLLEMTSWLPIDGRFSVTDAECGSVNYRMCKIGINGLHSVFAAAGALVSAEEWDIDFGTTRVTLGTAARHDAAQFSDIFRRAPQDNVIVY